MSISLIIAEIQAQSKSLYELVNIYSYVLPIIQFFHDLLIVTYRVEHMNELKCNINGITMNMNQEPTSDTNSSRQLLSRCES